MIEVIYPLPTPEQRHYSPPDDFILVYIRPERFIKLAPSLMINAEDDHYINVLAEQIRNGHPLDAPELSLEHHDGRHRAHAAKIAGVTRLPVYVEPKIEEFVCHD